MEKSKSNFGQNIFLHIYTSIWAWYLIVRLIVGDRLGFPAFLSNFVPILLMPILMVPFIGFKRQNWYLTIAGSLLTAFLLVEYGIRFLPRIFRGESHEGVISLISHNTGQNLPGYDTRYELISNTDADIVLLQEITSEFIELYGQSLRAQYPYMAFGPSQPDRDQTIGMGILSKYPINDISDFKLAESGLVFQQRAVIDYEGREIAVYNIHTTFPWLYLQSTDTFKAIRLPVYDDIVRRNEIDKLCELISNEHLPVIMGGDFNLGDQSGDYRKLRKVGLIDAYRNAGYGFGFTWPANRTPSVEIKPAIPFIRVDYTFHSSTFTSVNSKILGKTGSDHLPVWSELHMSTLGK